MLLGISSLERSQRPCIATEIPHQHSGGKRYLLQG